MKGHKKTSTTKLVARFDNELKTLLTSDLNNVKGLKSQAGHNGAQARTQVRLSIV